MEKFWNIRISEKVQDSRKLYTGIDILREIKNDTWSLTQIKDILNSFVIEQTEHNQRLEKILVKLAEK